MKETLQINGHRIDIAASIWSGKEAVRYDGIEVSSYRNLWSFSSFHSFQVQEAGEIIVYEVQLIGGFGQTGYAVRRNGIIQGHKP